ncbi:MAG: hypothetical protein COB98_11520 [Flavobacteriaceae bacterium]|nr:MAG: hypothetical protein COB98_11520 [Flavobacteriaceae bacterium]
MKRIIILVISIICGGVFSSMAQQLPQFTQYMYNTIAVNPAYAGSRGALSIIGLNRNQWVGFDGGPNTQTLSIHSPLRNEKIGVGLSLLNDKTGYENFTYAYADFSYTIKASETINIAFGLKGGFSYYKIDAELMNDSSVSSDPYFNKKLNHLTANFGAGIYVHTNKWYLGLSSPRLINTTYTNSTDFKTFEQLHYYGISGYVFTLNSTLKLKPTFLTKYTHNAPLSYDLTANLLFDEKYWLGGSYRMNGKERAIGFIADMQVNKQLRVGYAYEIPTGEIRPYTSGSHEILLIYEFRFLKSKFRSPRYF